MPHQLVLSPRFDRNLKKIIKKNPQLKGKTKRTLLLLRKDINHPSLGLHKLSGLSNWSVMVSKDIRIILHWSGQNLVCTNIGSHDEVY